ncbi:hypothetical protein CK203_009182 [Vitis vinifera]|uniref:Uncharacterized protein n=1 Tax=Vitis vinifera TaxID=29760 RepID=A0A438K2U7_VITVI|nr:hypothetical protein CK203_009182 [Vitis vinifera]
MFIFSSCSVVSARDDYRVGLVDWNMASHHPDIIGRSNQPCPKHVKSWGAPLESPPGTPVRHETHLLDTNASWIRLCSMCYMSGSIQMENVYIPENEVGMWQWLFGKAVTSIVLLNQGSSNGFVGIAAPSLARILPIDLAMFGGEILCQPDAFLCSLNDVKVNNTTDQRARNIVVGAEGFLRQKLTGQGLAFIVAGGSDQHQSFLVMAIPYLVYSPP